MKVRLLTGLSGRQGAHNPGEIVDMEDDQAKRMIDKGYAEAAETATRKAPEKATKGNKKV